MTGSEMAKAGLREQNRLSGAYRFATREEREGKVSTNLIFKECRQSAAMKRVLAVYGDMNLNLL